jgi:hypothetical protein
VTGNTIELEFGDGSYVFALPLAQINELQRKTGIGIGGLLGRVTKGCFVDQRTQEIHVDVELGAFYALDIIETVRHGLIGGGKGIVNGEEIKVTPLIANKLVDTYVLGQAFIENWKIAVAVLGACIVGYDPPKKDPPASERASGKARRKKKAAKAG